MPRKKKDEITKKSTEIKKEKKKVSVAEVLMGTGRRKTAVARVWLKKEKGPILVNEKPIEVYFTNEQAKGIYEEPLRTVNRVGQFSGTIKN
jgi:ribosomal protein S9